MKITTVFIAVGLMTGCSNLQTFIGNNTIHHTLPDGKVYVTPSTMLIKECPVYKPPEIGPTPLAPIAEFSILGRNDQDKRDEILLDYIEKLRLHISTMNKENNKTYLKYIAQCASE